MERNRSIDGWRGLSVTFVIVGHFVAFHWSNYLVSVPFHVLLREHIVTSWLFYSNLALRLITFLPVIGVDLFFVISGYLITTLLLKEEATRGMISLKAFYIRRIFRIFPAFYLFLLTMFVLSILHVVSVPNRSFVISGLFLCNISDASCTWWLGHTWTLAVEEQFYLFWPILLIIIPAIQRSVAMAILIIIISVLSFVYPIMISFLHIAVGALFALSSVFRMWVLRIADPIMIKIATLVVFIQPFAASIPSIFWIFSLLRPLLLAFIFFGTINGAGPYVKIVLGGLLPRIGLVSYSLYLWQQLSTGKSDWGESNWLGFVLLAIPAIISYKMIEKPMIRLGHNLSNYLLGRLPEAPVQKMGA